MDLVKSLSFDSLVRDAGPNMEISSVIFASFKRFHPSSIFTFFERQF